MTVYTGNKVGIPIALSGFGPSATIVAGTAVTTSAVSAAMISGPPGLSAYQVAVQNGFVGTQAQWLASLVGPATNLTSQPVQSANFSAVGNNYYPVNATSGNITVTLPISVAGQTLAIKKWTSDTSTNLINITGNINGTPGSTIPLRLSGQGKVFTPDGTGGWNIYAGDLGLPQLDARYQSTLALTTTGTSGPATLSAGALNIPQYSSGGGSGGLTSPIPKTGFQWYSNPGNILYTVTIDDTGHFVTTSSTATSYVGSNAALSLLGP